MQKKISDFPLSPKRNNEIEIRSQATSESDLNPI